MRSCELLSTIVDLLQSEIHTLQVKTRVIPPGSCALHPCPTSYIFEGASALTPFVYLHLLWYILSVHAQLLFRLLSVCCFCRLRSNFHAGFFTRSPSICTHASTIAPLVEVTGLLFISYFSIHKKKFTITVHLHLTTGLMSGGYC